MAGSNSFARRGLILLIVTVFVVGACQPAAPVVTPTPPSSASPSLVPASGTPGSGAVSTLEGVKSAVVQIEAVGTFIDPQVGEVQNAAGRGSGFIVDPSGLIVTNNHVVTGAALLKVWVGGEADSRNAVVLGVSECSDLAVIKIEGSDLPYLDWYEGDVTPGLDVYVAGYPLGDPEYTLTRGIVAKEKAAGDTSWASVPYVIQHDASTNPGNSGGPLVTADGKVVGVHYAANQAVIQQFAISRDTVVPLLEQLESDTDVAALGINGVAVNDGAGLSGIWVYSVASGSPADRAGVQGGDIVTKLENVVLATDGTMATYCGILRSHQPSDVLAIQVRRYATQEVLDGQINGRELTVSFSFADELGTNTDVPPATEYSAYTSITDDLNAITVSVPVEWAEIDGSPWRGDDGTTLGAMITAAPNIDELRNGWASGIQFVASYELARRDTVEGWLNAFDQSGSCTNTGRFDYSDPVFTGKYDYYTDCGGTSAAYLVVVAAPADESYLVIVTIGIATDADFEAADRALNTFNVIGTLP